MCKSDSLFALSIYIALTTSTVFCELLFTVKNWNTCLPDELRLKTIVGIAARECIIECGKRRSCENVAYVTHLNICHLYTDVEAASKIEGDVCLVISRQDIDISAFPDDCSCDEGQVCNAGICKYEECPQFSFANGVILGNKNDVGSRQIIRCESGYIETNSQKSVTCGELGNWSYIPSCLSTTVCDDITIANGDLIGTGNGVGAVRTIVCDTGYEEQSGQTSIHCKNTGSWSYTPTCSLITVCNDITIANGDLIGTGNGVGAVRTIVCDTGYEEQSGQTSIQCKNTGSWSYIPSCSLITEDANGGDSGGEDDDDSSSS